MINLDMEYLKQFKPHYFGLGFIQLKLNKTERLHFYHPDILPIVDEEDLHNHRYDFTSHVLRGKLTSEVYYIDEILPIGPIPSRDYELHTVSCSSEDAGKPSQLIGYVEPIHSVTFETGVGSKYMIRTEGFHRVAIKEPTLTYLERGEIIFPTAQVIKKVGAPDVCPFSKKLSEDEIWNTIKEVIG